MDTGDYQILNYDDIDLVRRSTLWSFLSIILYKFILDLSYFTIISPVWCYMKFELQINGMKLVESYFLLIVIFILMPKSSKKLSNVIIWLLILLSYVPMLTLFALKDESRIFMYAVTAFWMTVFSLSYIPSVELRMLNRSRVIIYGLFFCLTILVFLMIYKYSGFSFNIDFTKVYRIRTEFSKLNIPLAGYLFSWLGYIVYPLFLAFFFIKRKWILVLFIIPLQFYLFSCTGNKTFLFAPFFVFILMWVITWKYPLAYMAIGLAGIVSLGILSYWLLDDVWISGLFTRRTILTQPQLYFFYYDFFSRNDYTFLSQHHIFNLFVDYPYLIDMPHLIGKIYYGSPGTNANTGIVGDAYMNFGFLGLVIWSILIGLIFKIIDSCSKGIDLRIGVAAIAMPVLSLINSALLTNLLTHGLLLALLLLYLIPRQEEREKSLYPNVSASLF